MGDTIRINVIECLLKAYLEEEAMNPNTRKPIYLNGQQIADQIEGLKSKVHQIIDVMLDEGFLEKKLFVTH